MPDRTESGGVVAFHTGGTVGDGSDVLSSGKLLTVIVLTGFWPACPACGNRAKHDPPTGRKSARPGTGVPGRIPSKACGAMCFCGCRKTQTPTPRICCTASGTPTSAVQRRPAADPAAQGEGLAWRHGQEAGLRRI